MRRSMRRSWRLRQALAVLPRKYCAAMGCQFMPAARAEARVWSSSVVQSEAAVWELLDSERERGPEGKSVPEDSMLAVERRRWLERLALDRLGMV